MHSCPDTDIDPNFQSIMFDEERLDPKVVGNLPHVLTKKKTVVHIWSQRKI